MQTQNLLLNQYIGLLPARYWKRVKQPFFYAVDFLPAVGSATTNVALAVNSDSDFAWFATTRTVYAVGDAVVIPAPYHTVTMIDAGSGRQFMNAPVHLENLAGSAQFPYQFFKPIILGGGSTVTVSVTALAAGDANIRLVLHGLKLFQMEE